MTGQQPLTALGLMSGTSLDGIDAAIIQTDGERVQNTGPAATVAYDPSLRESVRSVLGTDGDAGVARQLTLEHAEVVRALLADNGFEAADIDIIGFHGHTVLHRPRAGISRQIGDGALLARQTGIPVVDDFRGRDVAAGGEGAPLAPLFHAALSGDLEKPIAVLNLGGVGNVTWIGKEGDLLAFDTGPGNALIDDWTAKTIQRPMDEDGRLALGGRVDKDILAGLLDHAYFHRSPPKSMDRDDFSLDRLLTLSPADGAATLTALTAEAVAKARVFFTTPPKRWLVCGGGRRNRALMTALREVLRTAVEPVESVGWQGDALEAQAFGFLAVRSLYGLPVSLPATTGVNRPLTGGRLHRP